ncbi:MAG TPA: glycosyltransferase family 39 protein [Solirubrobacteraceae bacterium]|nr:glycosyltransferase family 39 protein [Solirubrobacteraceae bacterium]
MAHTTLQLERHPPAATAAPPRAGAGYWPLVLLMALAAAVRFATLDQQSLWYDEAVTAVRVLHPSLRSTLSAVVHVENTPPLYYVLAWGWTRVLGIGAFALRSLSAVAGVALVAVAWTIGSELASRRTAIVLAAIAASNPLFVWYSQEARAYELFTLLAAGALLFFLRARRTPTRGNCAGWALCSALALLTHYFAAFLIVPEAALLLAGRTRTRTTLAAVCAVAAAGLALLPLVDAQGGRGTGWIANWPLAGRLEALAGYYLLGESGRPLGRAIMVLCALPILAALALLARLNTRERSGALLCAGIGAFAVLVPLLLALAGRDYFAPRYLIAAYVPLSAVLALVLAAGSTRLGLALAALICASNLLVVAAVDTRPQLQRGDWLGVARALRGGPAERAVVIAVIGALPLQYYEPQLAQLAPTQTVRVREIDLVGYPPLRVGLTRPPAAGFTLAARTTTGGIVILRFRAPRPVAVAARRLLAHRPVPVASEALATTPGGRS